MALTKLNEFDANNAEHSDDQSENLKLPTLDQLLAVFGALAAAVGQRIVLVLALMAAFAVAWRVIETPAPNAVWVFGIFSVVIFCPVVWLNARRAA